MFNLDHEVEGRNVMDQPAFHPDLGSREANVFELIKS